MSFTMMNREQARELAEAEIAPYREWSYERLLALRDQTKTYQIAGDDGALYRIEIQAFWDTGSPGNLRVWLNLDEGSESDSLPVSADFVMTPAGDLVPDDSSRG